MSKPRFGKPHAGWELKSRFGMFPGTSTSEHPQPRQNVESPETHSALESLTLSGRYGACQMVISSAVLTVATAGVEGENVIFREFVSKVPTSSASGIWKNLMRSEAAAA